MERRSSTDGRRGSGPLRRRHRDPSEVNRGCRTPSAPPPLGTSAPAGRLTRTRKPTSCCDQADLDRLFCPRATRVLNADGSLRFRHWRLCGERGLAGDRAAVWVDGEPLTLEYATETLAQHRVAIEPDGHRYQINRFRYFTAEVHPPPHDPAKLRGSASIFGAIPHLSVHGTTRQTRRPPTCRSPIKKPVPLQPIQMVDVIEEEEKGSDVSLGSYLCRRVCRRIRHRRRGLERRGPGRANHAGAESARAAGATSIHAPWIAPHLQGVAVSIGRCALAPSRRASSRQPERRSGHDLQTRHLVAASAFVLAQRQQPPTSCVAPRLRPWTHENSAEFGYAAGEVASPTRDGIV